MMRIALVHDYLAGYGGAERVLEVLHEMFPEAPIYTSLFLPETFGPHQERVREWPVKTSFLQAFPFKKALISPFRLVASAAFRGFDFSEFDLVLVSATGGYNPNVIRTGSKTRHLCFCHTPPRYLYGLPTARNWRKHWWGRVAGGLANHFLRMTDFRSSQKVDYFIANSREVAGRIKKFYRREARVIYPPVEVEKFFTPGVKDSDTPGVSEASQYFLAGGRLARAKRVDLAVEACTRLNLPLKVFGAEFAGYGEELRRLAGSGIEFLGEVGEEELVKLFSNCRAYLFCSDQEDFGITPVEAMAAGRPVIAYRSGGVRETVVEGKTGEFFDELTVDSLVLKLKSFRVSEYSPSDCRARAKKFSKKRFKKEIRKFIKEALK
jgi:glycosyltransferase involved in cell wall biosynthesis